MSNPSLPSLNIPNEQLLLINILNTMYNDNIRQINSLMNSNNEIRNVITNLLTNNRNQNNNNRYRNRNNNRDFLTRNLQTNLQERINRTNNSPYIIEEVQEYTIPYSQLQNWINSDNLQREERIPTQNRENVFTRALQRFLEPVEVFPTQSQIETATRRAMYCDIISPINRSCPISLETFNDTDIVSVIRHCGHIFNTQHLNTWFTRNCRCPICRYDIRNYNSSSSRQTDFSANDVTSSLPSVPLNIAENNANELPSTRRAALAYINSYLDSMGDVGNLFSDISGNVTIDDLSNPSILLTLFTRANNNNQL